MDLELINRQRLICYETQPRRLLSATLWVFGMTWPEIEHLISRAIGEHSNNEAMIDLSKYEFQLQHYLRFW